MKRIDVSAVLAFFGGGAQLARELNKLNPALKAKPMTFYQWKRRESIPGKWLPHLMEVAETKNKNFNLKDFLK
jgi:hypothetical protein